MTAAASALPVPASELGRVHATMVRIRVFELALRELFHEMRRRSARESGNRLSAFRYGDPLAGPELQGNLELAIGQEPVAAAVGQLRNTDYLAGTHRTHHLAIAKGVPIAPLVAEMFGRATGLCGGRAGDFNVHDVEHNFENSPVVGQLMPVAVGHALAAQLQGRDDVAMVALGDGGMSQGVFHESANLAGLWRLPVVFLLENNGYALSTSAAASSPVPDRLHERAGGYGFPGVLVDGNDPVALYEAAATAIDRARRGRGPTLIELRTDRLAGGFEGDRQTYRPAGELGQLEARDPLPAFERRLVAAGVLGERLAASIWERERAAVDAAIHEARHAAWPRPEDALVGVFAEDSSRERES
jgi:acetoin:2,6-dichlorophenolindophenol oxidoreductase subunit alpha